MSWSKWRQGRLGGRKCPTVRSIVQLTIGKEAFGRDKTETRHFQQQTERDMDSTLCGSRDCWSKKASWRCWDSDYARVRRYEKCWKRTIDNEITLKHIRGEVQCYPRHSERSCTFRWWGEWGRQAKWRRHRAWQAEQRWWTWLGDGHNHQNGTAPQGV